MASRLLALLGLLGSLAAQEPSDLRSSVQVPSRSTVLVAHDSKATDKFRFNRSVIQGLVDNGLNRLSVDSDSTSLWRRLFQPEDVIGIKVVSGPGNLSGTRPEVVDALVKNLIRAGMDPRQIIIWDKHLSHLSQAGFRELAEANGVRFRGAFESGFDEDVYYENELLGQLVWGDLAYGSKDPTQSRRSYLSKLVTQDLTKFILVTPLMNHNSAGVAGHLWSLTMSSADNVLRFERDPQRMAVAIPELFAMELLGDRVALCITDALLCQYQGEGVGLLHYSTPLNQLRFSFDPLALDVLSLEELERQRELAKVDKAIQNQPLYRNAALLQIGIYQKINMDVVYFP